MQIVCFAVEIRKDMLKLLRFMLTATLRVAAIACCLQRLQYLSSNMSIENLFCQRTRLKWSKVQGWDWIIGFVRPFKVSRCCCFTQELHMQDNHEIRSTESKAISPGVLSNPSWDLSNIFKPIREGSSTNAQDCTSDFSVTLTCDFYDLETNKWLRNDFHCVPRSS